MTDSVHFNNFDARSMGRPSGQAGRFPVRKRIGRTAGFDTFQDGAVAAALASGVLIDADHPRRGNARLG
ncbi:hypothetical protein [Streptomyces sp. RB17]|uniref:hypothetical protein n=1 Tax=Streptomyces sp. RB17 TaxID=2585197 RepID=UPI001296DAF8|nr:hypothetical protein [Streptomyces sp. RB17]